MKLLFILSTFFTVTQCLFNVGFSLPSTRGNYGVIAVGNPSSILIGGGIDNQGNILADIQLLNFSKATIKGPYWEVIGNLSIPRYDLTVTALEDRSIVFFAGGIMMDQTIISNIVDIYNWQYKTWANISLSQKYIGITSAVIPELGLVFFGGIFQNSSYYVFGLDIYNATDNTINFVELYSSNNMLSLCKIFTENNEILFTILEEKTINIFYIYTFDVISKIIKPKIVYHIPNLFHHHYSKGLVYNSKSKNIILVSYYIMINFNYIEKNVTKIKIPVSLLGYGMLPIINNNMIYLAGGYTGTITNQNPQNIVQIYDFETGVWSQNYLEYPSSFSIGIVARYNLFDKIYFLGGETIVNGIIQYLTSVNAFTTCAESSYYVYQYNKCDSCPERYFCPAGIDESEIFQSTDFICPQGNYCPTNNSAPTQCPPGTHNSNPGTISKNDCQLCPAGTFNILPGQIFIANCLKCYPGYICEEGSPIPLPCPNNYYCPDSTNKIPCPTGTYYNGNYGTDISVCSPCQKGSFCSGNGLNALPCEAGSYSDRLGNVKCDDCPSGHSCSYGASTPEPCQINSFATKGSSACTPYENGEFTEKAGSSSCMSCPSSKFSVDGWWCMTTYEKLIFVIIWITSLVSGFFSCWKIYKFVKNRLKNMIENGITISIKNFMFLEKIKKLNIELVKISEEKPILEN